MAEFTISFGDIFWFCSFIAALYGIWKIVKEIRKQNDDLQETVANGYIKVLLMLLVQVTYIKMV